jgi:holo-[acyl-carrier protein] synthase
LIHNAARIGSKEAVSKAFATGIGARLRWLDIDVVRDPVSGAPSVRLTGGGRALAAERGARRVWISLSHTDRQAIAQAMVTGGGGGGAAT